MENDLSNPAVTVITTVYKRTEFLPIALTSVFEQTFQDFEIIVADDSNSEPIRAICEGLNRSKVRYKTNETNFGVAMNLHSAIQEAKGEFITILNDDDLWEPRFLERLVGALQQDRNRVLAFCDHWIISETGEIEQDQSVANTATYGRDTLQEGDVSGLPDLVLVQKAVPLAMAAVFRKDALDLAALTKDVAGAYDFWVSCLLASLKKPAYYVPERLTRYRIHSTMETARRSPDKNENMVFIYESLLKRKAFPDHVPLLMEGLAGALYQVGKDRIAFNDIRGAKSYLRQSFRTKKMLKNFALLLVVMLPKPVRVAMGLTM